MALEMADMEYIGGLFNNRFDKMEERLFAEMEKMNKKVDILTDNYSKMSGRVYILESTISSCEKSSVEQGKRIGETERAIAVMLAEMQGANKEKGKSAEWVKWIVPLIVSIVSIVMVVLQVVK